LKKLPEFSPKTPRVFSRGRGGWRMGGVRKDFYTEHIRLGYIFKPLEQGGADFLTFDEDADKEYFISPKVRGVRDCETVFGIHARACACMYVCVRIRK
jgi:hypothetical protein